MQWLTRSMSSMCFRNIKSFQQDANVYKILLIILQFLLVQFENVQCKENALHTNEFAVHISVNEDPNELASRLGFVNKGQIGSLDGYFLFQHNHIQKRSTEPSIAHTSLLENDPKVDWVEQQQVKRRVKRNAVKNQNFQDFPDPLYPEQWFLNGGSFDGYDMNVAPAWKEGITGKGVVVSILDDGIQTDHPDLVQNYDKDASWDINGGDSDPSPRNDGDNKHGTRCAGEVAATAYNEFCGVGIAYNASIGGVRMLDGSVTDTIEASALSLKPDHIDIYSASWGPEDDGKTVDGPGQLAKLAFAEGTKKGRGGLGSIYVWASGNGGRFGDSCNCDGYTNSIYTLSISSATQAGRMPWYLEQCSSTLAATYSSGAGSKDKSIVTVDVGDVYSRNNDLLCTENHTGTSASAPIAAGICALALEANPNLTWRDMQYIVVMTSRPEPLSKEEGWIKNGVGRQISSKFGYGLMDAAGMVKLARKWKTVPPQHVCNPPGDTNEKLIPSVRGNKLEASLKITSCHNTDNAVLYLEHVQVKVTLHFKPRGNLNIVLVSPSGTPSTILLQRPHDTEDLFNNWPFMSVHFWGENPDGVWKLVITNTGVIESNQPGRLVQWSLVLYGTELKPANIQNNKISTVQPAKNTFLHRTYPTRGVNKLFQANSKQCSEENRFQLENDGYIKCIDKCPEGWYGDRQDSMCRPCDKSCQSCYGPSYDNCLMCPPMSSLLRNVCVKSCPNGYFTDSALVKHIVSRYCHPCSSTCETCTRSFEMCTSCSSGLYSFKRRCLPTCPSGTFMHKLTCRNCHKSCATCSGPYTTDCLSCKNDSFLYNSTCLSECPEGFYGSSNFKCVRCHRSCKYCRNNNSCSDCNPNWHFGPSNQCIFKNLCPKEWKNENSDFCDDCVQICDKCTSPQYHECNQCSKGFYWFDGKCVSVCPKETFAKGDECAKCSEMCSDCIENESGSCLACKEGFALQDTNCMPTCLPGFYNSNDVCTKCPSPCLLCTSSSNKNCTSCVANYYLSDNSCVSQCPDGTFPKFVKDVSECLQCHHLCKSCSGIGSMQCTSCYEYSSLIDGACIPCLDNEYFNKEKNECQRCHDKCGGCYGPLEHNCLSCQAPLRLEETKNICLPCCESEKNVSCCTCTKDLDICINSAGSHPRSIYQGSYASQDFEVLIPLKNVVPVVIAICASAVVLFVLVFGALQVYSMGWCHLKFSGRHYERVPSDITAKFDAEMEKVSLTQEDLEDEDDIYEKA